jgi:hypothetical protein
MGGGTGTGGSFPADGGLGTGGSFASGGFGAGGSLRTGGSFASGGFGAGGSLGTGGGFATGGFGAGGNVHTGGSLATGGFGAGGSFATGGSFGTGGSFATGGFGAGGSFQTGGSFGDGGLGSGGSATGGADGSPDSWPYECDPVRQNCASGFRCDLSSQGQLVFRCLPDQGGQSGQNTICKKTVDCIKGAACLQDTDRFGNPIGPAYCTVFCYLDSDCPAGNFCLDTGIVGSDGGDLTFGICLPSR